jgi:DNA-binding response OmpR family regulator
MDSQRTVLIVEDDPSLRNVLVDKLQAEGFAVIEAGDGKSGLDIALKEHPHCILLDIFMPRMDGVSMLAQLRSSGPWGKHATVIVLTNSTDADTIARVTGLGATDFLVKSEWSLDDIVKKITDRTTSS